jgi:putative hydrolase of HD superfamily
MEKQQTATPDLDGFLELVQSAMRLKSVARTGWLDRGIATGDVESVADHSFGVALLAWIAAVERQASGAAIRPDRVLLLALVHDLAEAEIGDRPPYRPADLAAQTKGDERREFLDQRHVRDPASEEAKRSAEDAAMRRLVSSLPPRARAALAEVWQELRAGESDEARFVKQVDRLETFLQSRCYLAANPDFPVASFEREVMETIDDPLLRALRDAALSGEPGRCD